MPSGVGAYIYLVASLAESESRDLLRVAVVTSYRVDDPSAIGDVPAVDLASSVHPTVAATPAVGAGSEPAVGA